MFENLINRHDVSAVARLARRSGARSIARLVGRSRTARITTAWGGGASSRSQWYSSHAVRRRWQRMVTGDPDCEFPSWAATLALPGARDLVALAPGCGTGFHVMRWAALGLFARIDAFDLSPPQVDGARAAVAAAGLGDIVSLSVGDMRTKTFPERAYDVILVEHALHHFTPLADVVDRLARALAPGGLLYADEYVGPTRFQWTATQLEAANRLLRRLPERLRVQEDGRIKSRVIRPSRLRMYLLDPSEAIESAGILPALRSRLTIETLRGYGGALLHLVLNGIAHNFASDDDEAAAHLAACFAEEDRLLASGALQDDFVVALGRPT